jgi:ABC-type uncharacterized transport system, permease component
LVFLWFAIYQQNGDASINSFTYPQMISYLIMASLTNQWIGNSDTFSGVSRDITRGDIATSLTRPLSYRGRYYAASFGSLLANFFLFFVPLFVICQFVFVYALGLAWPLWYNVIFYLLAGLLGMTIIDSFDFIIAQLGFKTNSLFGIFIMKLALFSFLSGAAIPFSFFPSWAQPFLPYLPFGGLSSTPLNIFLGRFSPLESLQWLAVSAGWAVVLYSLSLLTNNLMIKHVESVGG